MHTLKAIPTIHPLKDASGSEKVAATGKKCGQEVPVTALPVMAARAHPASISARLGLGGSFGHHFRRLPRKGVIHDPDIIVK